MRRFSHSLRITLALIMVLACAPGVQAEVSVTDDLGRMVRLEHPAESVIALYGAFNEMLAAMGREDLIAARTRADTLPPSILDKPVIGTHLRPNVELVAGLAPDLVVQYGGRKSAGTAVADIRRKGIPVAVFTPASFSGLFSVIRRLGVLTGSEDRAEALAQSLENRLDAVSASIPANAPRPRTFFEIRYPNLLGAGQKSMVSEVISRAGGVNCLENPERIVRLNEEELVRLDPEVYLVQRGPMNKNPVPPKDRPHFRTIDAVRAGRVFFVDEQIFSRPGPRSVDAVEQLARIFGNLTGRNQGDNQ